MKLSRTSLGLAVRAARDAAGLNLEQLAERTGITVSTLSRSERGERDITYTEVLALAEAIDVDVESFRTLAETFERGGAAEKSRSRDELEADLVALQRQAVETAIAARAASR